MNKFLTYGFFVLLLAACNSKDKKKPVTNKPVAKVEKHTIAILVFRGADSKMINELETGLRKRLMADYTIINDISLPAFAFYKPRQRYVADSLLSFLRRTNKNKFEKIIGITTKDIATRKDPYENWGVMGLGACPGEACVISSYRVGRGIVKPADFSRRMLLLALHELGHTYGLPHCPNNCIMKDAEGKMNLDDADSYCSKCHGYLVAKGLIK